MGEELTVETITGRKVTGALSAVNPGYFITFGNPIPELTHVGRDLRRRSSRPTAPPKAVSADGHQVRRHHGAHAARSCARRWAWTTASSSEPHRLRLRAHDGRARLHASTTSSPSSGWPASAARRCSSCTTSPTSCARTRARAWARASSSRTRPRTWPGSFKDRRASVSIHVAKAKGYAGVIAATSRQLRRRCRQPGGARGLKCIIVQEAFDSRHVGQPEIIEKSRICEAFGAEVVQMTVGPELFCHMLELLDETGYFAASLYSQLRRLAASRRSALEIAARDDAR